MTNIDRADLNQQLTRVSTARHGLDAVCWTVFSVFTAASCVLINAAVAARTDGTRTLVCTIGIVAAAFWGALMRRAIGYLDLQESIVERLEQMLELPSDICSSGLNAHGRETYVASRSPFRSRDLMLMTTSLAFVAWLVAAAWFVTRSA